MSAVLVVNDRQEECLATASLLRLHGYETACAASGPEALEYARAVPTKLMLLDASMPGMSGWDVLRAMRWDIRTSRVPVIVQTVSDDPVSRSLARELGAQEIVPAHPGNFDEVLSVVERYA